MSEDHLEQGAGVELRMPELGLASVPVVASAWLRPVGAKLKLGERLLEVLAGEVTVDLSAPAEGKLSIRLVEEDELIHAGQLLAVIHAETTSDSNDDTEATNC